MTSPRYLVTGATGFIGRHLSRHLAGKGAVVHALLRPAGRTALPEGVTGMVWDGTFVGMRRLVADARPDVVFHLATHFTSEHRADELDLLLDANIRLPLHLLDAMDRENVSALVNAGTVWQHFNSASYDPVGLYAASKQAAEDLIACFAKVRSLRAVTLLIPDSYGPNDTRKKLFHALRAAMASDTAVDFSPGEQLLDLLHVSDIVSAFEVAAKRVLERSSAGHERFALSSGELLTLRQVASRFERAAGRNANIRWGGRPYRDREVMDPTSGVATLPGWAPRIGLDAGLRTLEV